MQEEVNDGGQVICQVADTGCFDLPVGAAAFLRADNAATYTVSVKLFRYGSELIDPDHLLEVEAVAETRFTMTPGAVP